MSVQATRIQPGAPQQPPRTLPAVYATRNQALFLATLGFFGGFAGVAVFGPLVPRFRDLLELSPMAAALLASMPNLTTLLGITIVGMAGPGLLTATFSLLAALVRVAGGIASDRLPIRFALSGNFALMFAGLIVVSYSNVFGLSLLGTIMIACGMGLQNAIVFRLLPAYVPNAVGGASGWDGGLGALGGFVLPPLMGAATGMIGGPEAYARGFLPLAALVLFAIPIGYALTRREPI